jgi:hypothetical protein
MLRKEKSSRWRGRPRQHARRVRSPEFSAASVPFVKLLVPQSGVRMRYSHCARLQRNRLKTGNRNWNGFVHGRAEHFLSIGQTAATARWHWAFVIEIVADSIRIEHLRGNELPANVAKTVTQSEFEANIDSETVRERQRPAGFLHDGPLVSAGNQERTEAEKKKGLQSHERLGCFRNQRFSPAIKFSISANAEAISKSGHIP